MADYNSIINNVNANAAHSGINTDITQLLAVTNFSSSGPVNFTGPLTASGGVTVAGGLNLVGDLGVTGNTTFSGNMGTGTLSTIGNGTIGGLLTVAGGENITGNLGVTGNTTFGGNMGAGTLSTVGAATVGGNLIASVLTFTGGATADGFYSTIGGSILTAPGGAVRATNTVSARVSLSSGSFNNTFNISNVVNSGSTGIYNFTFSQPLLNGNYQVVASPAISGSNLISGVATSKTSTGFSVNYFTAAGVLTNLTGQSSDVIVAGGN